MKPDVSVIIVNHDRKDLLRECLLSVEESGVCSETFVVDNASDDGSVEMLEQDFRWIHLIRNRQNDRFAKPNNDAIRRASGRYVFLLNNDAILREGALQILVSFLDSHPDVGMVGPQLLNPDGTIQPSCHGFVSLATHLSDMLLLDRMFPQSTFFASGPMTYFDHTRESEVDHVMAAAALVRRDTLDQVGLFDEKLSVYYNDLDLSLRLAAAGWKTVFLPGAQVVHHGGHTARAMIVDRAFFREQYENIFHYYRKHFGPGALIIYKALLFAGFVPRAVAWSLLSMIRSSERARSMRSFSLGTLRLLLNPSFGRPPRE